MDTAKECGKQVIASLVMLMVIVGMNMFTGYRYYNGVMERNMTLFVVIAAGILGFYVVGRIFGIFKFFKVFGTLDKKDEKLS
jgi:RsiW-degrading membrane proteinase PrsW (M82 family)